MAATFQNQFPICPNCGSNKVYRSMRRGAQDWVRHRLLFQVPYRCEACDQRFFAFRVARHRDKEPNNRAA